MKKTLKIIGRVAAGIGLTVYVLIALANYSLVQSYVGVVAGNYFSKEWGGEVKIGALHAMPLDHLLLNNVLLVSPDNDTIVNAEKLNVRFRRFPFHNGRLELRSVYVKNTYFHFATPRKHETNLSYIINYFKSDKSKKKKKDKRPFMLTADHLVLNNVHYKMDLRDTKHRVHEHGVVVKHMEYTGIRGTFKDIVVQGKGDVQCRIVRLSAMERSGFKVNKISGDIHVGPTGIHAHNLDVATPQSRILADADLTWPGGTWKGMKGYVSTVYQNLNLKEGTSVAMSDVAYWAPTLWGNPLQFTASGTAYGTVDSLHTDGIVVNWGTSNALLMVEGTMRGLPRMDTASCDVNIERLYSTTDDLNLLISSFTKGKWDPDKEWLNGLSHVDMQAQARAEWPETATVNLDLGTGWGNAQVDATMRNGQLTAMVESANLATSMLNTPWITSTGVQLTLQAKVPENGIKIEKMDATVNGTLHNCMVQGQPIAEAEIDGRIVHGKAEVNVVTQDPEADLELYAMADWGGKEHRYAASLAANKINLAQLKLVPKDSPIGDVHTRITADLKGNSLDEMHGHIVADGTQLGEIIIDQIDLRIDNQDGNKALKIESDMADASVSGRFQYEHLGKMAKYFCSLYLPELLQKETIAVDTAGITNNTLVYSMRWKDPDNQLALLLPKISIAEGTRIDGSYNFNEQLKLVLRSRRLKTGTMVLDDIGVTGRSADGCYVIDLDGDQFIVGQQTMLENLNVVLNSNKARTMCELAWDGGVAETSGDLMLRLRGNELDVMKPYFNAGGHQWELGIKQGEIYTDAIAIDSLILESGDQKIGATLSLKGEEKDCIHLDFQKFSLNTIADIALQNSGLTAKGYADGKFSMYGLNETPYFNANLTIDSCKMGEHELGTVALRSNWNAELNILNLQLNNQSLNAHGWIGLGQEQKDLNFDVNFNEFDLALMTPILTSFTSQFGGNLQGSFDIGGTLDAPIVVGEAFVENGLLKIDATGVTYHFNDSIRFVNGQVTLDDFKVNDSKGNTAHINGEIRYQKLQEIGLALHLQTDNLLVLDLAEGDHFYGTMLVSAEGTVSGAPDDLQLAVRAQTNPGSSLVVPVNDQKQVKSQNYITFYNPDDDKPEQYEVEATDQGRTRNIHITADVSVTPDAKLSLPMSFSEVGVNVNTIGAGDIHLAMNVGSEPQVMGSYELASGTMKVSLVSLFTKTFNIEPGSSLNFQGSLPDARFDLSAAYSQRVNLSTLTGNLSNVDNTQKYLQVENIINIAGTLEEPTIGFDIRLPNADQSVEEEVFAYIDRNSERDMLNQTMSLLLRGQFYNTGGNSDAATAGGSTLGSGISMVASTLSSVVSDMVQFIDVNIDYKAANDLTNDQLDVNLSRDWGRWTIESTLGYGGESRNLETADSQTPVIDAMLSYRLSPLISLFVYNRTNTNDYTRIDLPYKQGVGLRLSKDFNNWGDLFRRNKKKTK